MRKITVLNHITVDGYFASFKEETGGMDYFTLRDPKVDEYVHSFGEPNEKTTLIAGGTTYRLFKATWQPIFNDPNAPEIMKGFAKELTDMNKIVFSKTMKESDWENTEFHDTDPVETVKKLKAQEGENFMIMGSGSIIQQLSRANLIDEYMLIINPLVVGEGKPLFKDVKGLKLKLISAKSFALGNVVLRYETAS